MIAERWGFSAPSSTSSPLASQGGTQGKADGARRRDHPVTTPTARWSAPRAAFRPGGTLEKLASTEDPLQGGRRHQRRQRQPDLRRYRRTTIPVTTEKAIELGCTPIVRIHTTVSRRRPGDHADRPHHAAEALTRSGLSDRDIGVYEVKGLAPVPMRTLAAAETGASADRLSPLGERRSRSATRSVAPAHASSSDAHPPYADDRHPVRAATMCEAAAWPTLTCIPRLL